MTAVALTMWATAGLGVGAVQARALLSQAARPRSHVPIVLARLGLVCTFAAFALLARAPSAFVGWVVGYPLAVATLACRLRRTT
jgi:hypothetical protein